MILETNRLILRPWQDSDAEDLYRYAKNPNVGLMAGWPIHTDVENSRYVIREFLAKEENYAVVIKGSSVAVGSIGLMTGRESNLGGLSAHEAEIGYWIAEPFWGRGYIPEAVEEILRHGFLDLNYSVIWCGYFDGNEKSKRVNEKCGFVYQRLEKDRVWPLIDAVHSLHVTKLTKEKWEEQRHGDI